MDWECKSENENEGNRGGCVSERTKNCVSMDFSHSRTREECLP